MIEGDHNRNASREDADEVRKELCATKAKLAALENKYARLLEVTKDLCVASEKLLRAHKQREAEGEYLLRLARARRKRWPYDDAKYFRADSQIDAEDDEAGGNDNGGNGDVG